MHRLVIATVTLVGLAGAAFVAGYLMFFSTATDRASALAPADTALYVNVYLQPSAGQQMNLGSLIGRFPGFADEASLDDKVDQVVGNLLGAAGLELDYRTQVKPWLGSQLSVATWTSDGGPIVVVLIDVKDAELALASMSELAGSETTVTSYSGIDIQVGDDQAYAIVDGMLILADTAEPIEAVVDVRDGADALASRDDFRATMGDLPADHLASGFVDVAALSETTAVGEQFSPFSTAGAALVAEPEGLRLSGRAPFDAVSATSSATAGFGLGGEPSSLVDWMPPDTIAEAVVFGVRRTLEDAEEAAGAMPEGQEIVGALDTFRALAAFGLGVDLDEDLLPLLDREVGVAFAGMDGDLPRGQLLLRPEDPEAGVAALDRIVSGLGAIGATSSTETHGGDEITVVSIPDTIDLAYATRDGIIIIGTGVEDVVASLEAHASGSALATGARYERTFNIAGERAGNEIFVDIAAAASLAGDALSLPADARDILSRIGTFGFTAPSHADQIEFHAVLTVDEP